MTFVATIVYLVVMILTIYFLCYKEIFDETKTKLIIAAIVLVSTMVYFSLIDKM